MGLYRILYSSSSVIEFGLDELRTLLEEARNFNKQHGITGLLLYHNRSFMQVIEGEEAEVRKLYYQEILHDPRHTAVHAMITEPIDERRYDGWHMGFKAIEGADLEGLEGFMLLPEQGLNAEYFKRNRDMADRFMQSFSISDI